MEQALHLRWAWPNRRTNRSPTPKRRARITWLSLNAPSTAPKDAAPAPPLATSARAIWSARCARSRESRRRSLSPARLAGRVETPLQIGDGERRRRDSPPPADAERDCVASPRNADRDSRRIAADDRPTESDLAVGRRRRLDGLINGRRDDAAAERAPAAVEHRDHETARDWFIRAEIGDLRRDGRFHRRADLRLRCTRQDLVRIPLRGRENIDVRRTAERRADHHRPDVDPRRRIGGEQSGDEKGDPRHVDNPTGARIARFSGVTVAIARRFPVGAELGEGGADFRLWAPQRRSVGVVIEEREHALARDGDGYFRGFVAGAAAGARYRFRLDDEREAFPDPASRFQPEGPHGPSEVVDPSGYRWRSRSWRDVTMKDAVLYDMHLGTFTTEGTGRAAIE